MLLVLRWVTLRIEQCYYVASYLLVTHEKGNSYYRSQCKKLKSLFCHVIDLDELSVINFCIPKPLLLLTDHLYIITGS